MLNVTLGYFFVFFFVLCNILSGTFIIHYKFSSIFFSLSFFFIFFYFFAFLRFVDFAIIASFFGLFALSLSLYRKRHSQLTLCIIFIMLSLCVMCYLFFFCFCWFLWGCGWWLVKTLNVIIGELSEMKMNSSALCCL